ncbi:GNAT family N-acetyltransferase [Limibaculum sp. M0105]|uniref:GNAT family N-acetyltransferase n=1 Tax=Thermohalobaculum xanthum TaxID=2753746 RepID=A0A8J7SFB5_9RHOB|nr:GNAT family N-acetyltransferase [Thermohalobaculum xanthum]MBK0398345.1 GNAT family N-acetyltransferase [Thermohalobaculum xanthum]
MTGYTIRRATAADADRLHAALARLALHLGSPEKFRARPADYLRHGFQAEPLFRALIAEEGATTMGVAVYFPEFSTMRGRPGVYLQDLWVADEARGGGLGPQLLAAVARDAAGWQASYMKLSAHVDNPGAIRFYRRLGFAEDAGEQVFVIDGAGYAGLAERA